MCTVPCCKPSSSCPILWAFCKITRALLLNWHSQLGALTVGQVVQSQKGGTAFNTFNDIQEYLPFPRSQKSTKERTTNTFTITKLCGGNNYFLFGRSFPNVVNFFSSNWRKRKWTGSHTTVYTSLNQLHEVADLIHEFYRVVHKN